LSSPITRRRVDFVEEPEPLLLMPYYEAGYIVEACAGAFEDDCVSALRQLLLGLGHLYGLGTAHRDLKPENMLVKRSPRFTVILADFGFVRDSS